MGVFSAAHPRGHRVLWLWCQPVWWPPLRAAFARPAAALPAILVLVLIYTVLKKELGRHHTPRFVGSREALAASGL